MIKYKGTMVVYRRAFSSVKNDSGWDKIFVIKLFRNIFNMGLHDAKELTDAVFSFYDPAALDDKLTFEVVLNGDQVAHAVLASESANTDPVFKSFSFKLLTVLSNSFDIAQCPVLHYLYHAR